MLDEGKTGVPEIGRFIGAATGRNRMIGGLFLHTTGKTSTTQDCTGEKQRVISPFVVELCNTCIGNLTEVTRILGIALAVSSLLQVLMKCFEAHAPPVH